jgi:hypothetical protein
MIPAEIYLERCDTLQVCLQGYDTPNLGNESGIHMGSIHEKKSEAKNLVLLYLYGKFVVSTETEDSTNILVDF